MNILSPITQIETNTCIFKILDNGVGHMHAKDGVIMDIPEQIENLKAIIKITGNRPTPFMVTAGEQVTVTMEARKNAIATEDLSPFFGTAVVVSNLAHLLIAQFYYKVNKPKNPYKVFRNEEKAMEWCLQFVNKP